MNCTKLLYKICVALFRVGKENVTCCKDHIILPKIYFNNGFKSKLIYIYIG